MGQKWKKMNKSGSELNKLQEKNYKLTFEIEFFEPKKAEKLVYQPINKSVIIEFSKQNETNFGHNFPCEFTIFCN